MSKLEGTWQLKGLAKFDTGAPYDFSYQFIDDKFYGIDNISGEVLFSGVFFLGEKTITFVITSHNVQWAQEYALTDSCLELKHDAKNHRHGKLFKVDGVS
jgi:ABC-type uncharacterized transport system ATPase subunit